MSYDQKLVGRNLRHDRLALRMTQQRTAEQAGLSLSFYQKLERGEAGMSVQTLGRLCRALYIEPASLFSSDPADRGPHPRCVAQAILDLPPDRQEPILTLIRVFLGDQ